MAQCNDQNIDDFLNFVFEAPEDQDCINMDCDDYNEAAAQLAERVANGEDIKELMPKLEKFMHYWTDCREEFDALVAVLRAEQHSDPAESPDSSE